MQNQIIENMCSFLVAKGLKREKAGYCLSSNYFYCEESQAEIRISTHKANFANFANFDYVVEDSAFFDSEGDMPSGYVVAEYRLNGGVIAEKRREKIVKNFYSFVVSEEYNEKLFPAHHQKENEMISFDEDEMIEELKNII